MIAIINNNMGNIKSVSRALDLLNVENIITAEPEEIQKADKLIYTDKKFPLRNAYASLTEDERFLIISGSESTSGNSLAIQDMNKPSSKLNWIIPGFKDDFHVSPPQRRLLLRAGNKHVDWFPSFRADDRTGASSRPG